MEGGRERKGWEGKKRRGEGRGYEEGGIREGEGSFLQS